MAWRYGGKVLALYVGYEPTNTWVYIDGGLGWLKLSEDHSDATLATVTVLTHAKADNRFLDIDEEPEGHTRYVYVW